jgi:predicted transcriptional regulator
MACKDPGDVRLNETDFMILDKLREGRNTAANLAVELDRNRKYINSQMGYLLDYELVEKVGPLEDSGLYELTDEGQVAVEHRELYEEDPEEFDQIVSEAGSE